MSDNSVPLQPRRWHVYFGRCTEIDEEIFSVLPSMRDQPKIRVTHCHLGTGCDLRYLGTVDHNPSVEEVLGTLEELTGDEFLIPDTA